MCANDLCIKQKNYQFWKCIAIKINPACNFIYHPILIQISVLIQELPKFLACLQSCRNTRNKRFNSSFNK